MALTFIRPNTHARTQAHKYGVVIIYDADLAVRTFVVIVCVD